jgi:hypothetical protein
VDPPLIRVVAFTGPYDGRILKEFPSKVRFAQYVSAVLIFMSR